MTAQCRSCKAEILWRHTWAGRRIPIDVLPDPLGNIAEWRAMLAELPLEECFFRMMAAHEVGRGCGFDVDFADHKGAFVVWGSARDQVDGFGNAVSPPVGTWFGNRMRPVLHGAAA